MKLSTLCAAVGFFFSSFYPPLGAEHPRVVVLSCTDRPGSYTRVVAQQLYDAYQEKDLHVDLIDVADFGPEWYRGQAYLERPADFQAFNDLVLKADVVVMVTPEYNATIPAPLTRVINLLSYPDSFNDKKFVIVSLSVSPYGAIRAHNQLKTILTQLHAQVMEDYNLTLGTIDTVTKSAAVYAEHAEKIATLAS